MPLVRLLAAAVAALVAAALLVVGWDGMVRPAAPAPPATELPAGVQQVTTGGRSYLVAAPRRATGLPLVVALHGRTGSPATFLAASGALAWAREGRAVVIAPETAPGLWPTAWNAGACCDGAAAGGVDDVAAVAAMVAEAAGSTGASAARVSVLGFSNGAMLGYRIACERPDLLAGLVAVAGARLVPCPRAGELALLDLHGGEDRAVPVAGAAAVPWQRGLALPSAAASVRPWGGEAVVLPGVGHRLTARVSDLAGDFLAGHGLLAAPAAG